MANLEVNLIGDSRSLERAFRRSERAATSFNRTMSRVTSGAAYGGFGKLGRIVGAMSLSFAGAYGLASAAKAGFGELFEGQKVAAQTAAALKSTGAVAGVTAGEINKLASSLQQLTGYDDEAIQSAENLILTFTNIRNVTGQGNNIFDQAATSVLDLSRTFDQDLSASAVQLGKALQEPVRGITALRRIGISFSDRQRLLITRLVKTGRVLEAQKIILREVRRQTEGAAAAYGRTLPGQLDILRGNLQNLAGDLAEVLAPEVTKLTTQFNKWLQNPEHKKQIIDNWAESIGFLGGVAKAAAEGFGWLKTAWDALPDFGKNKGLLELMGRRNQPGMEFKIPGLAGTVGKPGGRVPAGLAGPARPGADLPGTTGGTDTAGQRKRRARMLALRNQWFDARIGRMLTNVQDIAGLKGQIAQLGVIAGLIRARIAVTKDVTRRLNLEDKLLDVLRTQKATRAERTDLVQQLAGEARDERMGWLNFAIERAEDTKKLKDDRTALRAKEKFLAGLVRHDKKNLKFVSELWRTRKQIRDLNKKNDFDPLAGLFQVSSKRMVQMLAAGTGLDIAGRHRLSANVAGMELRPINVGVHLDGREIGRATTKDNARTSRRTDRQTSGFRG